MRYQRHALIDWFDQKKLREASVAVIGAGAVGNEVLKNLALLGLGHIRIFDFDRIEEHNLTRCALYRETDVGLFKAEVAANACRRIDPNLQIESLTNDFWDGLRAIVKLSVKRIKQRPSPPHHCCTSVRE